MLDDRLAKGFALPGVVARRFEGGAGHATWAAMPMRPPSEVGQGDAVALALLAQPVGHRHAQILEGNLAGVRGVLAELVLDPYHLITGLSVGTIKALIPRLPASGSVTAKTITVPACLPDVMNCLAPLST